MEKIKRKEVAQMKIDVKAVIIPTDDTSVYDVFGIQNTSPGKVLKQIEAAKGEDLDIDIISC